LSTRLDRFIKTYPPLEEKINIWSHVGGLVLSLFGLVALAIRAQQNDSVIQVLAVSVFGLSMVCLYAVSALYHGTSAPRLRIRWRVYDHACIYILIAGTYTPFALITLPPESGYILFFLAWGIALAGVVLKIFYTGKFDRLSTLMYVAMGWMAVFFLEDMAKVLTGEAIAWLAAGGIIYTLGAVMYSIERIPLGHAVFHICVLLGSLCHFICVYFFVLETNAPV